MGTSQPPSATSLSAALTTLFAAPVQISPTTGGSTTTTLSPEAESLLAQAQASYTQAQADLKAGNLAAYQNDINAMESSSAGRPGADRRTGGQHHHDHHQPELGRRQRPEQLTDRRPTVRRALDGPT